ncbi:two-component system connector SafA, partial [Escherichia coli]
MGRIARDLTHFIIN